MSLEDAAREIWAAEAQQRKKIDVSHWGRNVAKKRRDTGKGYEYN